VSQLVADVVCFRHLHFGRLSARRQREVDELGGGGGDQADAPPDQVLPRFGFLGFSTGDTFSAGRE
jgi:hypothetical protein